MSQPIVEVTFPVRIRLPLDTVQNAHELRDLRDDILGVVIDACVEESDHALYVLTPADDHDGRFGVVVDKPTVELVDYVVTTSDDRFAVRTL